MMGYAQTAAARCSTCDYLRKECSAALGEYLRVLAERNAARKRRDHDLVEAFEEIENESSEKCQNARQAISDHEDAHILEKVVQRSKPKTEMPRSPRVRLDSKAGSADEMEPTELLSH
jgi:hypothetical protein